MDSEHRDIAASVQERIERHLQRPEFRLVGYVADRMGRECYVVGGYVRDIFLDRASTDIDFVTVGSGIEVARAVAHRYGEGATLAVFKTYGTAQVKARGLELEFVGARRESYNRQSRNPIVEDGTLDDDQRRRDFTINAMAISLNRETYGRLLDPFDGIGDLGRRLIRTPLDPDITFSDDPLRMMRAVRFATQLNFEIYPETMAAIGRNCKRIGIITRERVAEELMKIMRSARPSRGFELLKESGLLPLIFPELSALSGVETMHGRGHKDNFRHTMQVLDTVAAQSSKEWLRWAALLHDIGKPATKKWDDAVGWTFHNHNFVGEKMVPRIFSKMRLPMNENMKYVKKLVGLHMRPIALVEDEVTDSAVRRLLFDAGDDIDDLMLLCNADITSKNQEKVRRFRENFQLVKQKLVDIEEKDRVRNFQPPIDGEEVMVTFGLEPSRPVGEIKDAIKDAILDGVIRNEYAQAYALMLRRATELGLKSVMAGAVCYRVTECTPVGRLLIACDEEGVVMCGIMGDDGDAMAKTERMANACGLRPERRDVPLLMRVEAQLREYFGHRRKEFDLPLHLIGTEFQRRAWAVLRDIPYGATITYRRQAELTGNEKAYRAVAQANHANPVAIIVPCHRVVASDGGPGGYGGGVENKLALLELERSYSEEGRAPTEKEN